MIALTFEADNRKDEAERRYQQILEMHPTAVVAANNLAWIFAERGEQLDRALQLALTAKQQLPSHPSVSDTLGWVYYKKNIPQQAVALLEDSVKQDSGNPSYHYHLGMAYLQSGDQPKARQSLQQALRLKSDFSGADEARRALATLGG
jgi:Tfp pilus assembly protein PilF